MDKGTVPSHSLPTFPTSHLPHSLPPFPTQPRVSALPPPAFPARAAAFSSRKSLTAAAFPGSGCRRRPPPPRPAPSPCSRSLLFIHSFIDSSSHSFIHASAPCGHPGMAPCPQARIPFPIHPPIPGAPRAAPRRARRALGFTGGSTRGVVKRLLWRLLPGAARGQRCFFTKQTPRERRALAMRGRSQENITFPLEC